MADNLLLPISLEQMTGSDGEVFVSAVYVYDAGTSDLKNVYTDATLLVAAANPIIADGDGVLPARYIGTGSYKLVIKDTEGYPTEDLSSHWTTFKTIDNLPGALDTSSYSNDEATPITPVISKTSDYAVISTDQGNIIDADPTGGNITITLPSAVTVGDNWRITIKHHGSANEVTIVTTGSQTIDDEESFVLDDQYESVTLVSDGANWIVSETGRLIELVVLPRGFIDGCEIENGSDATNDINISSGACRDSSNLANITVAAMTKQIDANWAAGTSAGMRNSAASATNTTYGIYAVSKADGTQDIYAHALTAGTDADSSAFIATVITALQAESGGSGYIYARRIASIMRESNAIVPITQDGDEFLRKTSVQDYSGSNPGTSAVTVTLKTPLGTKNRALIRGYINTASSNFVYFLITSPDETDATPAAENACRSGATGGITAPIYDVVRTNTSSQIRYRQHASLASDTVSIVTRGWIDRRGKDA